MARLSPIHLRQRTERRDQTRHRHDLKESRTSIPSQVDAQQFLGKVWATMKQESSRHQPADFTPS